MRHAVLVLGVCMIFTVSCGELFREIKQSGSHREIVTKFDMPAEDIEMAEGPLACSLLFIDTIPSAAFVDPYQLDALRPFGGPDFYLEDAIDLEKPDFLSKEFKILVYCNLTKVEGYLTCEYKLPVHLRYHSVSDLNDFAVIKFVNPKVALRCVDRDANTNHLAYRGRLIGEIQEFCDSGGNSLCDWEQISVVSEREDLELEMAVGKEEHYVIVTVGTILTTVFGCVFLIYKTLHFHEKLKAT